MSQILMSRNKMLPPAPIYFMRIKWECIMKGGGERGEERDTTTHLTKNASFTYVC
jgi:hypothetical protein